MARRRPAEPTANPTRGAILVVIAVVAGLFLLRNGLDTSETVRASNDDDEQATESDGGDDASDGAPDDGTTTTTTVALRAPAEVPVVVLNGTTVNGAAGRYSEALAAAGYQMGSDGNAEPDVSATQVFFAPEYEAEAAAVASAIGAPEGSVAPLPATPPGEIGGAQVVVVIGPDLASTEPPAPPSSTTETTAAG